MRRKPLLLLAAVPVVLAIAPVAGAQGSRDAAHAAPDAWNLPPVPAPAAVTQAEHARRRAALAAGMGDGVLMVMGEPEPDADYLPFAQNSTFRYLTGVTEPDAALLVEKRAGKVHETLFVLPRNPSREIWEGARMGAGGATRQTGMPARPVTALRATLDSLLAVHTTLYTLSVRGEDAERGTGTRADQELVYEMSNDHHGLRVVPLDGALARLRAIKSPAELDQLRRAVLVTTLALREAMRSVQPGMAEFETQALIEGTFRRNGGERPGFASIVGSGPNSTTLHYREADRMMAQGEVVVMDVGAAYRGYSADVTRTVPISGTFTPRQREIYEVVLQAQKSAEQHARAGATWAELNAAANTALAAGLARLGLIDAPDATYRCGSGGTGRCPQLSLYYPHGLGHGIGLDVHDPDASYFGPFGEGSAFTLEPGIYVRSDLLAYLPDVPENRALRERLAPVVARYVDTGVRIEDDYVVTGGAVERLSAGVPREADEIEALMRQESPWNTMRRPEVVDWYHAVAP
jgi:Xaa-Pro aminopeptidase